jgi:hypothetical protein
MDPSTSAEPLEFSDLQGQTLTKQPGELNGCGLPRAPLPAVKISQCRCAFIAMVGKLMVPCARDAGRAWF